MKFFGTDGIRQKADTFTPDFIYKVAAGLIDYAGNEIKVLIGGDTRESSEWMIREFEIAFETLGVEYASVGILPTPAINYCFFEMGFDFAIDITASHNPYTDNGIKIFERGQKYGQKLCSAGRDTIEKSLLSEKTYAPASTTLREDLHNEAVSLYKNHLEQYLGLADFKNLHIGMDCANGATSVINQSIFEKHGAKVELINANPEYGTEINLNCGSTHLEQLQALVKNQKLDFGVAFDGDGDRCLLVDNRGEIVDGDEIIAILTNYFKLDKIAVSVMANQGLLNWAKDHQITVEITPVGDSNVALVMREKNIKIGGEQSGHIILPNETTGDGMLTSLIVTKVISETKTTLQELAAAMTKYPQVILNLDANNEQKQNLTKSPAVKELLLAFNEKLTAVSGRLLVRPSGTEPLIRITMWGNDEKQITELAADLKNQLGDII